MFLTKKVEVGLKDGLHARPAAQLVKMASAFPGEARVLVNDKAINLKSIVSVMAAGIKENQVVELQLAGDGAESMLQQLALYLRGEGE